MAAKKKSVVKPAKKSTKSAKTVKPKHEAPLVPTMRGLRRAEALSRQIERWKEKWTLELNAGEWLKFAAAGQAQLKLVELDARRQLGDLPEVSRMSAMRASRANIVQGRDEDEKEDEEEGKDDDADD